MDKKQLSELMESAVAWVSSLPLRTAVGVFSAISLLIGFMLMLRPSFAIEIQKKFYAKINWRIEPISIEKEIRHTRLMGLFTVIFLLAALYLVFFTDLFCP
jgi:hypothetical protein